MLDLGPVEKFDRSKVPKEFWLDNSPVPSTTQDAQHYEKYRRRGGLFQPFGKLDSSFFGKPVFPPRREGGCGMKDGCDDSRKDRFPPREAPPKQTMMVENTHNE